MRWWPGDAQCRVPLESHNRTVPNLSADASATRPSRVTTVSAVIQNCTPSERYGQHEKEYEKAENSCNNRTESCYFVHDDDSDDQLLDDHTSDTIWKQRYMNLRRQIRKRGAAIGKYKKNILEAVMADI